jgi:FkbM family methyltransferase
MIKSFISKTFNFFGYKVEKKPIIIESKKNKNFEKIEILLDTFIDFEKYNYLSECYVFIKNLKEKKNAKFNFDNGFKIEIDEINFYINSWEEMFILNEIFIENIYNIELNENFSFIDIGMNVGFTSLFFANKKNCINVFSFEPFKKTYDLALKNLSINKFSSKINAFDYGLGFPERVLEVEYNENFKGSMGINGLAEYIEDGSQKELAQLYIKDVSNVIEKYKHNFSDKKIVKIDCEGSEYEIFDQLDKNNQITTFDYYLIEWHIKGPKQITDILLKYNYKIISFNESADDIGMIYAFK